MAEDGWKLRSPPEEAGIVARRRLREFSAGSGLRRVGPHVSLPLMSVWKHAARSPGCRPVKFPKRLLATDAGFLRWRSPISSRVPPPFSSPLAAVHAPRLPSAVAAHGPLLAPFVQQCADRFHVANIVQRNGTTTGLARVIGHVVTKVKRKISTRPASGTRFEPWRTRIGLSSLEARHQVPRTEWRVRQHPLPPQPSVGRVTTDRVLA